jgi:hypothetical protein
LAKPTFREPRRRYAEEANFGRGVEPKTEQEAKRVHLPGILHKAEQTAEETSQKASVGQDELEIVIRETATGPHGLEHAIHRDQHDSVGTRDSKEEEGRHHRPNQAADGLKQIELILKRSGRQCDRNAEPCNNG